MELERITVLEQFDKGLKDVLFSWASGKRAALVACLLALEFAAHLGLTILTLLIPAFRAQVDVTVVQWSGVVLIGYIGFYLICAAFFAYKVKTEFACNLLQFFMLLVYSTQLLVFDILIGGVTILSGINLVGGAIIGFFLLNRVLVLLVLLYTLITMIFMKSTVLTVSTIGMTGQSAVFTNVAASGGDYAWVYMFSMSVAKITVMLFLVDRLFYVVKEEHRKVTYLSEHDPLTGLRNRQTLRSFLLKACKSKRNLSVILLDVDHFKKINDTFGHQIGDKVLQEVAKILQRIVRASDHVWRFGGEEFLVLLQDVDHEGAVDIAERLRKELARSVIQSDTQNLTVHASFGVASVSAGSLSRKEYDPSQLVDQLVKTADQMLYEAKAGGRNRVNEHLVVTSEMPLLNPAPAM